MPIMKFALKMILTLCGMEHFIHQGVVSLYLLWIRWMLDPGLYPTLGCHLLQASRRYILWFLSGLHLPWLDYLLQTVCIIHDTILEQNPLCIHKVQKILDLFGWVLLFSHQEWFQTWNDFQRYSTVFHIILYNPIFLLEIRVIIKISSHPWYPLISDEFK